MPISQYRKLDWMIIVSSDTYPEEVLAISIQFANLLSLHFSPLLLKKERDYGSEYKGGKNKIEMIREYWVGRKDLHLSLTLNGGHTH